MLLIHRYGWAAHSFLKLFPGCLCGVILTLGRQSGKRSTRLDRRSSMNPTGKDYSGILWMEVVGLAMLVIGALGALGVILMANYTVIDSNHTFNIFIVAASIGLIG